MDWNGCDSHYRYITMEKITPDDSMRKTDNSSFWKSYAADIGAGPPENESGFDLTTLAQIKKGKRLMRMVMQLWEEHPRERCI
jgi:hypothetical protein